MGVRIKSRVVVACAWLLLGAAMIIVPVLIALNGLRTTLVGHPVNLVLTVLCLAIGIIGVLWAVASLILGERYDEIDRSGRRPRRRTPEEMERQAKRRIVLAVPAMVVSLLLVIAVGYASPRPATAQALSELSSDAKVRVVDKLTWYEFVPDRRDKFDNVIAPTTGLVFYPGGRVDPQAYAAMLRPLAEAGYLVAVLKVPLSLAMIDIGHARSVIDVHPEIGAWAVSGHSLGGVAAAAYVDGDERVDGLVLYASYPSAKIKRPDFTALSLYGSADEQTTPARVDATKSLLPEKTHYVQLDGATHDVFGDYGGTAGDGATDQKSRAVIVKETAALLESIKPAP
ncbi:alpha/beta hydrolase [Microlunatus speluncae]|uniref:alpha/beta hydrolase n=1 Tax=Microlunatus speluncae TaxID=2594267 RepID=UPI0012661AD0|nr:alpha/beta hydrolase [Microlunatus speluncae]